MLFVALGETDVLQLGSWQIDSRRYSVYLVVMDLVVVGVFIFGVEIIRRQLLRKVRCERLSVLCNGMIRVPKVQFLGLSVKNGQNSPIWPQKQSCTG